MDYIIYLNCILQISHTYNYFVPSINGKRRYVTVKYVHSLDKFLIISVKKQVFYPAVNFQVYI
jgi:hypothetical protein